MAANAGLGVRYVSEVSWGANAYYDYRRTSRYHYNQIGAGFEAIGSFWSVAVNGYLPVGKKKTPFFDASLTGGGTEPEFAFFQGNQFFITLSGNEELTAKREFAFRGIDANAAFRLVKKRILAIDLEVGPYYFHGYYRKNAIGGKSSLSFRVADVFSIGVIGSYDSLFHARVQGTAGFSIPLGPRSFGKTCSKQTGSIASFSNLRLARGAERSEIVVVDRHEKVLAAATSGETVVAINPSTGLPYHVWFVNNTSHSDGTFESPFPTLQEAFAVAQTDDIIYVYPGDGTSYDTAPVTFLDRQMLLGSGVTQVVQTTFGPIAIPASTTTDPKLENMGGSTILTLANENTLSGFELVISMAGDTILGNSINGVSFLNNTSSTTITGINSLRFTDCFGALLVQNNQFTMDAADTNSNGIVLTDGGTEASTLTVVGNVFVNYGSRAMTLGYTGTSSPTLNVATNTFSAPVGVANTAAIDLNTSNGTILAGSITGNICTEHQGYGISGFIGNTSQCSLTIANNTLTSFNGAAFSRGISFYGSNSSSMSLNINNNTLNNHTERGIDIFVDTDATVAATIHQNTLTVPALANSSGIQASANNSSAVTSTYIVTNNICTGHSNGNIQSFPQGDSQLHLNISNNVLTSISNGVAGINPTGILVSPGTNVAFLSLTISGNNWTGPATYQSGTNPQGINVGIGGNATASNLVVSGNTATLPLTSYASMSGPVGITLGAFNTATITGLTASNNTVLYPNSTYQSDSSPNGIALNLSDTAQLSGMTLVSGNTITYAVLNDPSLMNFNPQGIQVSSGNNGASAISSLLVQNNTISQIGGQGISLFAGNASSMVATINNNHVTATGAANMTGINLNATDTATSTYIVTNNACTGHTNGSIQSFPNGMAEFTLTVSDNTLVAATNGISTASSVGIQFGPNGDCHVLSAVISGNTLTGPLTYQPTGTPQGIQSSPNANAIVDMLTISNNAIQFPLTSYQPMTSPQGIQVGAYDNAQLLGVDVSNNSVDFLLASYEPLSSPLGIQLNTGGFGSITDATIFNNTVTFAPLTSFIADISLNGIQVGAGDTSILGTALSPILVEQNTVTNVLTGIGSFVQSSQDSYVTLLNNTVSLGVSTNTNQLVFGISTGAQGAGKFVLDVNGNTIEGNNQGFFGMLISNQSGTCQEATVQNNTITNVIGINSPVLGAGGGIGVLPLAGGDFVNVLLKNNALSGNMPQGIMGIDSDLVGGSANLCIIFEDNHGVGMQPADGYTLLKTMMPPPYTFTFERAGNTGIFNFVPDFTYFIEGSCSSCP